MDVKEGGPCSPTDGRQVVVAAVAEGGCFVLSDRLSVGGLPASEQTTQIGTNPFEKPLQTFIV